MQEYLNLLDNILKHGKLKHNRTKYDSLSIFGYQMRYSLENCFPLVTTKKIHFKSIVHELLWFISGSTNIKDLIENGVRIWNEWPFLSYKKSIAYKGETLVEFIEKIKTDSEFANKYGSLGPVYGKQWRNFIGVDQLKNVVSQIKENPDSRRLIVSAWNPSEIELMQLPPCHTLFQFYVYNNELSAQLYQRSADVFLGIPFNIASYALLIYMIAHVCGLKPKEFVHTLGDAHIYVNHIKQVKTQLNRTPRPLPTLRLNPDIKSIFDFKYEDVELINYNPLPLIKGKVAV